MAERTAFPHLLMTVGGFIIALLVVIPFLSPPAADIRPGDVYIGVDKGNLLKTIEHLQSYESRYTWEKQWETARWIEGQFAEMGFNVSTQTYAFQGKVWPNVVARLEGTDRPSEIVMVVAHLDSVSDDPERAAPGADDNASGVAAVLESARVLNDIPLGRTVMFIIFSNEEQGRAGSTAYARQARQDAMDIKAVINLDVLGYNPRAGFSSRAAFGSVNTALQRLKAIYAPLRNYICGVWTGSAVTVAGRELNRELVLVTAAAFRVASCLTVNELVDDDCG